MSGVVSIIVSLSARGVVLTPCGDRLNVRPASRLASDELEMIRENKAAIIRLLTDAKEAADSAVSKQPRGLVPAEKAAIARLVRLEHEVGTNRECLQEALGCLRSTQVVDAHIRDAIDWCEAAPSMREHLLTLARSVRESPPHTPTPELLATE